MILNSYWRSGAAYRLRIALNLKGLAYEIRSVHLVKNGGEQHQRRPIGRSIRKAACRRWCSTAARC